MSLQWLNYHHLYYFWIIAKEGGVAKASQKLRLGQPTLSTQLRQLEDALGKPLFERRNRRLVLTETGQVALDYAEEIFRLGSEMVEVIHDRLTQSRQHVQIGALDSVPKSVILRLTQQARGVESCFVSVLEGKGDELLRELMAHRIDLLVSNYPPPAGEQFKVFARSLGKSAVGIYGAKPFTSLKKGFPRSLAGQGLVLPTAHSRLRQDLEHFFKTHQIQIEPVAETQDTSLQKLIGTAGLGLVPMNELEARDLVRQGELVQIGLLENVTEELWLISASRKIENPIAARLMKTFQL